MHQAIQGIEHLTRSPVKRQIEPRKDSPLKLDISEVPTLDLGLMKDHTEQEILGELKEQTACQSIASEGLSK